MEWEFEASFDKWESVGKEIDSELAKYHVAVRERRQFMMAVEEIVANILFYAGSSGQGVNLKISLEVGKSIWMEIKDDGKPFDPLENPSPDLTETARKNSPGGLGIYMARRLTDKMYYEYKEGMNHLTLTKRREKDHNEN